MADKQTLLQQLHTEMRQWETLAAGLTEAQATDRSGAPGGRSVKDDLAHLWTWQQRSIARLEAGVNNTTPKLPQWLPDVDPESEADTDQINAYIYETYHDQPWPEVYGTCICE